EIARPLFEAQVDEALEKAMVRLQLSAKEYRREILALPEDAPLPEPPAELTDLSALASEFSMNAEETVELSVYELSQTDVGMAFDENFRLVWQAVFGS